MAPSQKEDRGEYRGVYVALVDSPEYQALSAAARLCLHTLKLKLGKAGIDVFYPESLPRLTGFDARACEGAVEELQRADWIRVEGNVTWLRNGLRFDPADPLASPNGRKGVESHLKTLPKLKIVEEFAAYYALESPGVGEAPSKGLPSPFEARKTEDGERKTEDGKLRPRADARGEVDEQADVIMLAANEGMKANDRIREAFNPIPLSHGSRQDVLEWLGGGVNVDVAKRTVFVKARDYEPQGRHRQINTMRYFTDAVLEAHDRTQNGNGNHGSNGTRAARSPRGVAAAGCTGKNERRRRPHGA